MLTSGRGRAGEPSALEKGQVDGVMRPGKAREVKGVTQWLSGMIH